MESLLGGEYTRWEVKEIGISGDGEFTKWVVHSLSYKDLTRTVLCVAETTKEARDLSGFYVENSKFVNVK